MRHLILLLTLISVILGSIAAHAQNSTTYAVDVFLNTKNPQAIDISTFKGTEANPYQGVHMRIRGAVAESQRSTFNVHIPFLSVDDPKLPNNNSLWTKSAGNPIQYNDVTFSSDPTFGNLSVVLWLTNFQENGSGLTADLYRLVSPAGGGDEVGGGPGFSFGTKQDALSRPFLTNPPNVPTAKFTAANKRGRLKFASTNIQPWFTFASGRGIMWYGEGYTPTPPPGGSILRVNKNVQREDSTVALTVGAGTSTFDRYIVRSSTRVNAVNDQPTGIVNTTPTAFATRTRVFASSPSPGEQTISMELEPVAGIYENNWTYYTVLALGAEGAWYKMGEVAVSPYGTAVTLTTSTTDQRSATTSFQRTRSDIGYQATLTFDQTITQRGSLIRYDENNLKAGAGKGTTQDAKAAEAGDLYVDMRVYDNSRSGVAWHNAGSDITSNFSYISALNPLSTTGSSPGAATPYQWDAADANDTGRSFIGRANPPVEMSGRGERTTNFQAWTQPISGGSLKAISSCQQVQVVETATATGTLGGIAIGSPAMGATVDLGPNPISTFGVNMALSNPYPWGEYYLYLVKPSGVTVALNSHIQAGSPATIPMALINDIEANIEDDGIYRLILAQYTPVDTGSFNSTGIPGTAPVGTLNASGPRLVGAGTYNYGWSKVVEVSFRGQPPPLEINASISIWE